MACLGRSQEDLRFSGPLGLVHRTQQHPVPSVFCFCFFCQSQRGFCCHFKGRTVDFFSGVGYCCVGVSLVVQSRSCSVVAVCGLFIVVAPLVVEQASAAVVGVLSSCGHGLSCSAAVDLPGPAIGPCPALPCEFLTTRPPGKSPYFSS